jgi:hypothetical protein
MSATATAPWFPPNGSIPTLPLPPPLWRRSGAAYGFSRAPAFRAGGYAWIQNTPEMTMLPLPLTSETDTDADSDSDAGAGAGVS